MFDGAALLLGAMQLQLGNQSIQHAIVGLSKVEMRTMVVDVIM
jgi:hypothetical protein